MSIRRRMLILLLTMSLAPLLIVTVLERQAMRRLGGRLAADTRRRVTDDADRHLRHLVEGFTETIRKEGRAIELALRIQAREAERLLAAAPPKKAQGMIDVRSVDWSLANPPGMEPSEFHRRRVGEELVPMPVAYDKQIYFLPTGVEERSVRDDLARLSRMTSVYGILHKDTAGQIYWQYTALESGLHTSYPAHGPLANDFDPRDRPWYALTKTRHGGKSKPQGQPEVVRSVPFVDVASRSITIAGCLPVYGPEGSFAGVTAIEMPITHVMEALRLPEAWEAGSRKLIVGIEGPPQAPEAVIRLQQSYQEKAYHWDKPVELEPLRADDPERLAEVLADLRTGKGGVRKIRFQGRQTFWAYARDAGYPAVVIIVPEENIIAPAVIAEEKALADTRRALQISGAIVAVVLGAVLIVGPLRARTITRPIQKLGAAASRIAAGDFRTRVEIPGRDELHRLGEAFNDMSAGLAEREKLKASLAVAMEIQQHLLPLEDPKLAGFDIVGQSLYCDETGGDYYDFIELLRLGEGKLGIALGDVSGHGISAALLMASARAVLRSHAGVHGDDLAKLFDDINVHIVRDTGDERFVTLFYGVLDGPTKTLYWSSAGQDPALWVRRSSGEIEELPNTGVPLGIIEEASYGRGGPVTMESGDVIVIGTDGIWEAANEQGELFGKERLRYVLKATSRDSAAKIRSAIVEAVADFRGPAPQKDDITLVVIKAL